MIKSASLISRRAYTERYTLTISPGYLADEIERAHRASSCGLDIIGKFFVPREVVAANRDTTKAISNWLKAIHKDWYSFYIVSSAVEYQDEHHFTVTVTVAIDVP